MDVQVECFRSFSKLPDVVELPERFTFPFYYEPHPLSVLATEELQRQLEHEIKLDHNFGLDTNTEGMIIGKMFGVLVVQTQSGELGYLAAFSGKLANSNHHEGFVPPVFDMLTDGSFFLEGIEELNELNRQVEQLEQSEESIAVKNRFESIKEKAHQQISTTKDKIRQEKKNRKSIREKAKEEKEKEDFELINEKLRKESIKQQYYLKDMIKYWDAKIEVAQKKWMQITDQLEALKEKRRNQSAALQEKLFEHYSFLNIEGKEKNLRDIFGSIQPPAGSGECAAPKLLQYAFLHHLKPITMAEFWWGASPKSAIRKHKNFYPACRGKCQPILGHMLEGIETDPNPMLENTALNKKFDIVYEDEVVLIINKPHEFLSVPGKNVTDSVAYRLKKKYPDATGPLVVHRLDMSTSGLMLIAKTKEVHKYLQYQFIKKIVKKRYVALLDGELKENKGTIDLPLRVDLDDRPRQLVCYEHGKSARTHWEVIERKDGKTRVHFFPITGRTHQLRVHAAHQLGLNTPIVGDDLYGIMGERLHLHAESIEFTHPTTKEKMSFEVAAGF
ncbi:MAG: pseudouridine synthase [Bacteroidota bacterium]